MITLLMLILLIRSNLLDLRTFAGRERHVESIPLIQLNRMVHRTTPGKPSETQKPPWIHNHQHVLGSF